MNALTDIEKDLIDASARKVLNFRPGDTVKVYQKIIEGTKERIQLFEGVVISIANKGASKTFTVRRISYDVGVERLFLLHSPRIAKIEVVRRGHVRRAKLYYLREKIGKSGRIREKKYAQILKIEERYTANQNTGATEEASISADTQAEAKTENITPEVENKAQ